MTYRSLLVISSLLLQMGCTTTYYSYKSGTNSFGAAEYVVSAGLDTGPEEDRVRFVHPELVLHAIEQPESNVARYYRTVLYTAYQGGTQQGQASNDLRALKDIFDKVATKEEKAAYIKIITGNYSDEAATEASKGFARAVGLLVSPSVVQSIAENGYGRIAWGQKVTEDFRELKFAMNIFYITVNKKARTLTLHGTTPHDTITSFVVVKFDLASLDDGTAFKAKNKDGQELSLEDYRKACAETKPLSPEDWKGIKRL